MANLIQLKRASAWNVSEDPGATTLAEGELAWNNQGKKLWMGRKIATTGTTHELLRINKTLTGTTNEVDVSEGTDTWPVGLPNSVTLANDLSVGGDITVTGDLTVNGTQTTINSTTVTIDDKTFVVADGQSAANCDASGYFISDVASLIYEHTGTKLQARVGASLGAFEAAAITGTTITATSFVGGNVSEWDTAYSQTRQWDGGSTGLVAATGRTSLGLGGAAVLGTAAVADGASTLSTGDQIFDFVASVGIDGGTF